MKICVFSDVHGNSSAYSVAHPIMLRENADIYIYLGDLCGYYYDQIEIFGLFQEIPRLLAVKGNHDKIFLEIAAGNKRLRSEYLRKYGHSMENLLQEDYLELEQWLTSLPDSYYEVNQMFVCFHGSPDQACGGYVYQNSPLDFINEIHSRYMFLGHTHYKMKRKHFGTIIINPGSLGQPRDSEFPSYAIVDTESDLISFHEIIYEKKKMREQIIEKKDADRYLMDILDRTRDSHKDEI